MDEYKQFYYDIFGNMRSSTNEEKQLYSDMLDKISIPITEDTNIFDIDLNSLNGKERYGRVQ